MLSQNTFARRVVSAVIGAGAVLFGAAVPAQAQPDPPNCTTADLAGVMTGVAAATSAYLFTHPPVNEFFTTLRDIPDDDKEAVLVAYMDANPQVLAELKAMRQPAADFRNRCG
ncbi:MAG: heme-binding protein [Actinomycetia bacterium]|nr:heme-binding protein [Actinomycetes bacterium]